MEVLRSCNDIRSDDGVDQHGGLSIAYSWDVGELFQLAKCPACRHVSIRRATYHSGYMDPGDIEFETLYPQADGPEPPHGLPDDIRSAFESAARIRALDPNAYGITLGRLLELVCQDMRAEGNRLIDKLRDLSEKGVIPERLADIAHSLRRLRNIGAHADSAKLTEAELPVLDNLTRAILEYVYTAPALVEEAAMCLKRLRGDGSDHHTQG